MVDKQEATKMVVTPDKWEKAVKQEMAVKLAVAKKPEKNLVETQLKKQDEEIFSVGCIFD